MSQGRQFEDLRRSFDESFALPLDSRSTSLEDLLVVRVGGDRFALRVAELAGLHRRRRIVRLPGSRADLLGLAGIRGRLVPVFSLAVLLGYAADRDDNSWLILCNRDQELALSFGEFTGHVRVEPSQICPAADGHAREHLREVVRIDSGSCPLVGVPSIVSIIQTRIDVA